MRPSAASGRGRDAAPRCTGVRRFQRDADAPTTRAAPQRWAVADRRSPPRPHTRAPDSPSNRSRERSSSSWWPCVPTRPGDAPTPPPARVRQDRHGKRPPCVTVPDEWMDCASRRPQASNSLGANRSGWWSSGVLGFCCSRIGLGASNTRPRSSPKPLSGRHPARRTAPLFVVWHDLAYYASMACGELPARFRAGSPQWERAHRQRLLYPSHCSSANATGSIITNRCADGTPRGPESGRNQLASGPGIAFRARCPKRHAEQRQHSHRRDQRAVQGLSPPARGPR